MGRKKPLLAGAALVLVGLVLLASGLLWEPAFYGSRTGGRWGVGVANGSDGAGADLERLAGRMMTKAASLHAAMRQDGAWEALISEGEINAWLALDLPRNHATLLPSGLSDPRVCLQPRRAQVGARVGYGFLSAVIWCDVGVQLRGVTQIVVVVNQAGLGALPLPRAACAKRLADRLAEWGLPGDMRPIDGRMGVVLYTDRQADGAGAGWQLTALQLEPGEAMLAGTARNEAAGVIMSAGDGLPAPRE